MYVTKRKQRLKNQTNTTFPLRFAVCFRFVQIIYFGLGHC